ncbi:MAG TPA: IclR family transcriptional regulator [Acetobacteraceae bacterium]|jgi:IclR family KDG regulon transcriptional repressor
MAQASRSKGKTKSRARSGNGSHDAAPPARDYSIAAVGRALDLLEALSRIGPAPLAALASQARCTRTAGFRLLRTLEARGFAIQDEARGMWRLGARWGVLGRAAAEQGALEATAMPFLVALGKTTGENAYLRVRDGLESETVAIYQADPGLRLYSEVGKRQPLHAGSSRLLLAHAPEAVQTQVLAQRLPRFTPATRTDAAWIAADLQRIRSRGYLLTTDEVVAGAATVAAPVRDASGQVVAVLSVSAPTMRMRPPRPRALLPMVLDAAAKLSRALGAAGADAVVSRSGDATRRPAASSSGVRPEATTAAALAATGPHSMFR